MGDLAWYAFIYNAIRLFEASSIDAYPTDNTTGEGIHFITSPTDLGGRRQWEES